MRLLDFPSVFAFAEMHEHEYGRFIHLFVQNKLDSLRSQRREIEQASRFGVFNAPEQDAKLYYYMLRNLIRRNDPAELDNMRFLLDIPSVKDLVTSERFDLLPLAVQLNNQEAALLLLAIPEVRRIAEAHNYYATGSTAAIDWRQLAQDHESSMHALSVSEQRRLERLTKHHAPEIRRIGGVNNVLGELTSLLQERYAARPAEILRDDGTALSLPMDWDGFQALDLNVSEKGRALEAYYKHIDHSAFRLFLKPNPWIHHEADYVQRNDEGAWADYDGYKPLIATLFLAARDTDPEASPCDGYTIDTRVDCFINELEMIARAHNWDTTYDAENAIDDLQADRPSCYSGMKTRLFQSVLGHPMLNILTSELVINLTNDFVRQHFIEKINEHNRDALKAAWDNVVAEASMEGLPLFKTLDIPVEKQQAFIDSLIIKYGVEFTNYPIFTTLIRKTLQIDPRDDAHLLHFGHLGIDQLLAPIPATAAASSHGIFAVPRPECSADDTGAAPTEAPK